MRADVSVSARPHTDAANNPAGVAAEAMPSSTTRAETTPDQTLRPLYTDKNCEPAAQAIRPATATSQSHSVQTEQTVHALDGRSADKKARTTSSATARWFSADGWQLGGTR